MFNQHEAQCFILHVFHKKHHKKNIIRKKNQRAVISYWVAVGM